jgi:glycosyltransferase involved in cell wall biosynthesis
MRRVSVIVPAHNASDVIEGAIASVRSQTYSDWEVVVADDASSDDTARRAETAGARVVRLQANLGPAGARNAALAEATGELVAFLDADDEWLPNYLEHQVARYDAESGRSGDPVGVVACDAKLRSPDGTLAEHTYLDQFRKSVEPLTLERVLSRNCVYISALVPRAAGEQVGWFDEDLFGTEDHDLWIKILETGHRAVLNREVLAVYARAPNSISQDIARQGANNQKTYRRALERGRLSAGARRIAKRELRYNRALEAAARAWFNRDARAALRAAPTLAWVAVSRPGRWRDWASVLRAA